MTDGRARDGAAIRPVLVSTQDKKGGAFRSSYRLHRGLLELGVESEMLVQRKVGSDPQVAGPNGRWGGIVHRARSRLDRLPLLHYPQRETSQFTPAWVPRSTVRRAERQDPDVVHLHWVARGGGSVADIGKLSAPVVWTLHDMWPFTGGCHYSGTCDGYRRKCGSCPVLGSSREYDLSRTIWNRKRRHWTPTDFTVVTPSHWLAGCARQSSLFRDTRIEVIPYGLDLQVFRPVDRRRARRSLGLPTGSLLILFGALQSTSDPRKGFHLLKPALRSLDARKSAVELVVFGAEEPSEPPRLGFPIHYLGHIDSDERLATAYSAADVFVAPSLQDNLPNTVLEATACGTPTVAFEIGGMPDMIEHRSTGYLVESEAPQALAHGLSWIIEDADRVATLGRAAREKAEREFALLRQARQYRELYTELLAGLDA